jgi:hypothetical protein
MYCTQQVHDMATLIGYGADGVCPYVGYEALAKMNHDGQVEAKAKQAFANEELFKTYRKSLAKGILKVQLTLIHFIC